MNRRPEKSPCDQLRARLIAEGQLESYLARPRYQRTDCISWIERAVKEETREKRTAQMLEELKRGNAYMGMSYKTKKQSGKE